MASKVMILGYEGNFMDNRENPSVVIYEEIFEEEGDAREALANFHKDTDEKIGIYKNFKIDYIQSVIANRGNRDDTWTIVFSQTSPK